MSDAPVQFRAAIVAAGLSPPSEIVGDGEIHRFSTNGDPGDQAGWYALHSDDVPFGMFGCWRQGTKHAWHANSREYSAKELAEAKRHHAAMEAKRKAEEAEVHAAAPKSAEIILQSSEVAPADHPYLVRKKVKPHGLRVGRDGRLIVPLRDADGTLHSLQFIAPDGQKRFLTGGRKNACFHLVGGEPSRTLCIAEGFATAASIHEATGYATAMAFDAGNLLPVAKALRAKYPSLPMIVCADDDIHLPPDRSGLTKAKKAARAIGARLAVPNFGDDRPDGATDLSRVIGGPRSGPCVCCCR
jgi:putative DNA primase/helicase